MRFRILLLILSIFNISPAHAVAEDASIYHETDNAYYIVNKSAPAWDAYEQSKGTLIQLSETKSIWLDSLKPNATTTFRDLVTKNDLSLTDSYALLNGLEERRLITRIPKNLEPMNDSPDKVPSRFHHFIGVVGNNVVFKTEHEKLILRPICWQNDGAIYYESGFGTRAMWHHLPLELSTGKILSGHPTTAAEFYRLEQEYQLTSAETTEMAEKALKSKWIAVIKLNH